MKPMARPLRIEYPGAVYHIMNRGLERREIFQEERDYEKFLELIEETHRQYQFRVQSYCLMPNHYHLYMETPQGDLSKGMRHMDGVYTQVFNKRNRRVGPLFQGRYKAILVEKESYSLELSRYIHLNPVKAKLVERPEQWRWSSYGAFVGKRKGGEFLEMEWLLGQFSKKEKLARQLFENFTWEGFKEEWDPWKKAHGGYLLGGESFCQWVRKEFLEGKEDREIPTIRALRGGTSSEEIQQVVKKLTKEEKTQRKLWIYGMRKYSRMGLKEIGEKVGGKIGYSGVSWVVKRLEEQAKRDRQVRRWFAQIEKEMSNVKT